MNNLIPKFEPMEFINNLHYMGKGMLAIFIVIAALILSVFLIRAFSSLFEKKDK